jgi:ribosome-associated protein
VPVRVSLPITLGQFVKLAGIVSTGGEAKQLIASGSVRVNGDVDTRRGRKLVAGDVVAVEPVSGYEVVAVDQSPQAPRPDAVGR